MLNVGLLGAGRIVDVHATAVFSHPGSHLASVSDYIPANAEKLAAQYGSVVRTTEEIIADPAIDTVLIATSTDTHSDDDGIDALTMAEDATRYGHPVRLADV